MNYYIKDLKDKLYLILNGYLVRNKDGSYTKKDPSNYMIFNKELDTGGKISFNFKFSDKRYNILGNLRRLNQIVEKDKIYLNKYMYDYDQEKNASQNIMKQMLSLRIDKDDPNGYKDMVELNNLLSEEEEYLLNKITTDQINYMKNKIDKLLNPCADKKMPVCKKINQERTITLYKPMAKGGLMNKHLEEDTVRKQWKNRDNFEWYKINQLKNMIIESNIDQVTRDYFFNKYYIDNLWEKEKVNSVYKFTKEDRQESISYNIEGECYNPKSDDKNCCNNNGNFNLETGKCECLNGWEGESCERCGQKACPIKN